MFTVIATLLQERIKCSTSRDMRKQCNNWKSSLQIPQKNSNRYESKLDQQVKQTDDTTDKLKVALASTDKAKEDYNALQAKYQQLLRKIRLDQICWNHNSLMQMHG